MTEYEVDSKRGNRRCQLHNGDVKLKQLQICSFLVCVGAENRKCDAVSECIKEAYQKLSKVSRDIKCSLESKKKGAEPICNI